jgi:hypothetical protein
MNLKFNFPEYKGLKWKSYFFYFFYFLVHQ